MKRYNFDFLRRTNAESEKDRTMRWGMAGDCYAMLVVAWWHPRGGAEYRLPPSYYILSQATHVSLVKKRNVV